jgi:hypothetical protein
MKSIVRGSTPHTVEVTLQRPHAPQITFERYVGNRFPSNAQTGKQIPP